MIYQEVHELYSISQLIEKIRNSDNNLTYISEQLRQGIPHSRREQRLWITTLRDYNITLDYFFEKSRNFSQVSRLSITIDEFEEVWRSVYKQMLSVEKELRYLDYVPKDKVLSVYIDRGIDTLPRKKLYQMAQINYKLYSYNIFVKELLHSYLQDLSEDIYHEIELRRKKLLIAIILIIPIITGLFVLLLYLLYRYDRESKSITTKLSEMQRMESIGRSTGKISHDLKNMLSGIIGFSEILLEEEGLSSDISENLHIIRDVALQAADLSTAIEHISREDKEGFETVELYTFLTGVKKLIPVILPKRVHFSVSLPEKKIAVEGNELQLYQVFMNLSINASHAIIGEGEISILATIKQEKVTIIIEDSGQGIAKENLTKIFESGFSTKGKRGGSGYGLSIVHGIIQKHNGSITVDSTVGEGSRFSIELPLYK